MNPFSDEEYIKQCLFAAAEEISPEKVQFYEQVNLFHQTVERKIDDITNDISLNFSKRIKQFVYYSLDKITHLRPISVLRVAALYVIFFLNLGPKSNFRWTWLFYFILSNIRFN